MKVSLKWLQTYFDAALPSAEMVADAFTFHAFEIEESMGDLMDVKVLPNRAADCLSHRGIAKELSAILDIPMKTDPLRLPADMSDLRSRTCPLEVDIVDPTKCLRYVGAVVKGVKIGPSPAWLKEALELVGQRSINNVVDVTNYVMLNIGQPLHAFDAAKLGSKDGRVAIQVRAAREGEAITTLSGEEYALPASVLVIADANEDRAIAIAGVKGGKAAEVTTETTNLVIESANFDGTTVRRSAQKLRLFTDASLRFQNRPSPELAAYGMRDVLALIMEVAGGEVVGVVDSYPLPAAERPAVSVTLARINGLLGSNFMGMEPIKSVFERRLGLHTKIEGDRCIVTPPFERTDLVIPEDLVEEVGRILGYDHVPAIELPSLEGAPDQARFRGIERVKDFLVDRGFIEISTQSFAKKGDLVLANPLDKAKPALRTSLTENMQAALAQANYAAPLVLAPNQKPKLFEVGTIFTKTGEELVVETSEPVPDMPRIEESNEYEPKQYELGAFRPFSIYPFIARDISMWITDSPESRGEVFAIFAQQGTRLLQQVQLLDQFTNKEGRQSLAFRLIFQAFDRTLTDDEVNAIMEKISAALRAATYEVR